METREQEWIICKCGHVEENLTGTIKHKKCPVCKRVGYWMPAEEEI